MTTDTEALRAQFEKLLSDSGRACLYEGDGQYAYPHDFAWICFQAGHDAAKAETATAGEPVAWAHFAKNGNIRLWAPERPRDLDGNAAQPLYTADQLAAAVAAERERAATVVDEKIGSVCKANPGRGGRINSAVAFALGALRDCAAAIRAGAKEPRDD